MSRPVESGRVLVRSHPVMDTQPCTLGHYDVQAVEMWILGAEGLTHWRTSRSCLRCRPVSGGRTLPFQRPAPDAS